MQAPARYAVCGSIVRPHSSITSPFAILVLQVSAATRGYCSWKNSKTVFQRPGGSHRELGPTPAMLGSGAFIDVSKATCPTITFKTSLPWCFIGVISCDFVDSFSCERNRRSTKSHEIARTMTNVAHSIGTPYK
jgi:hypothetical protein